MKCSYVYSITLTYISCYLNFLYDVSTEHVVINCIPFTATNASVNVTADDLKEFGKSK